jgi:hypothetical protein
MIPPRQDFDLRRPFPAVGDLITIPRLDPSEVAIWASHARERRRIERDSKDARAMASGKIGPKRRRRIRNRTP